MNENELLEEYLYNDFDSSQLLSAVGYLDKMRRHLADGVGFQPPSMREDLMDLHKMVFDVSNGRATHSLQDIIAQVGDIETGLGEIREQAKNIQSILNELNSVLNEVYDEIEGEEK